MDYRYLKAFILTVEFQSFSKAANNLHIAQSAVSRQIKLLEESLNEELIIRSSKKILLTNKGKELYRASSHFNLMLKDIFDKEDMHPLRIGILQGLLRTWFTPRINKFLKKYDKSIQIKVDTPSGLKRGLEQGKHDIIFSNENIQTDLISSLKLFEEKMLLISKEEVNRKKLNEYRWIVYGEGDHLYKVSKKKSEKIVAVESMQTILELVRYGLGIAIVPDHILTKNITLNTYDLGNLDKSEIYMTTLNFRTIPAHMKELINIVNK